MNFQFLLNLLLLNLLSLCVGSDEIKQTSFDDDFVMEQKINLRNSRKQFTPAQSAKIERSKKVEQILSDLESSFEERRRNKGEKVDSNWVKEANTLYGNMKSKWSSFRLENNVKLPLPGYIQDSDKIAKINAQGLSDAQVVITSENLPSILNVPHGTRQTYIQDDTRYEDDDCDKKLIRKYIKKLCERLDEKQRELIHRVVDLINAINHGSVLAAIELAKCLQEIEGDLLDILKEILLIIDKLIEIGVDAVKLVIEAFIELFGAVIRLWEDKACGCDCPTFLHSLLKYIIDIITWTPQKLLAQLIQHIIDIFTSLPLPRCQCACEGIYALALDKREEQIDQELEPSVEIQTWGKKRKAVPRGKVNSPILNKFDLMLEKQIAKNKENSRTNGKTKLFETNTDYEMRFTNEQQDHNEIPDFEDPEYHNQDRGQKKPRINFGSEIPQNNRIPYTNEYSNHQNFDKTSRRKPSRHFSNFKGEHEIDDVYNTNENLKYDSRYESADDTYVRSKTPNSVKKAKTVKNTRTNRYSPVN